MISPEKRDANRNNARKSTGPRTDAGKARSSRNAVTHGLTAQPGEPTEAYREALAEWVDDLQPRGIVERTLAERACRAAWNLRRCDRYEDATAFRRDRDAGESYELAEAVRVEAIGRRLLAGLIPVDPDPDGDAAPRTAWPGDEAPALLVAELRRSSAGVGWLMARWGELARALKAPGGWGTSQGLVAVRLLGLRPDQAAEHPVIGRILPRSTELEGPPGGGSWFEHPAMHGALDAAAEAEGRGMGEAGTIWLDCVRAVATRAVVGTEAADRKRLAALVRSEREKLARVLRRVVTARAAEDRAGAADRAMFEESRSLSLCLRYATAASRDLHRAIRDLAKLREDGERDDPDSPQPPPQAGDGSDLGPHEGEPGAIENAPACPSVNFQNEATGSDTGSGSLVFPGPEQLPSAHSDSPGGAGVPAQWYLL